MLAARAERKTVFGEQLSLSITRQAPAVSDRTWPERTPLHPAAKRDFRPIHRQNQSFEAPIVAEAEFFRTYSTKPRSFFKTKVILQNIRSGHEANNLQTLRTQRLMTPQQFVSTHILSQG
jgi:hypothetical protein